MRFPVSRANLVDGLWSVYDNSPLARLFAPKVPARLARLPPPAWPGDPTHGANILAGRLVCGVQTVDVEQPDWHGRELAAPALAELHGFAWLDDLAAVGGEPAQTRARRLIADWIEASQGDMPCASDPEVIGRRVASWLGHAKFIARGTGDYLAPLVLTSLVGQLRRLVRLVDKGEDGLGRIIALRGLIYGALCGVADERRAEAGFQLLVREIERQVLADGGHIARSPLIHLRALAALVDIRDMAHIAKHEAPAALVSTIERMAAGLRFFRHGDGGLALFNGSNEQQPALIDAVLARAAVTARPADAAGVAGFQRLAADRALVLLDASAPPPAGFDRHAHAGTLSFEMSWGRERIIVNCGANPAADAAWRHAQRSTAAHSTLIIDETNSAELLPGGGLGRRPQSVECGRRDDEGNTWIDTRHDGYRALLGLIHRRRLYLSSGGDDLRGEDTLTGGYAGRFTLRFHLHPDIQASLVQNGAAVLLRSPSGAAWRFFTSNGPLELAESVYLGRSGEPRRSEQIVLSGALSDGTTVKWALRRMTKP